jgi:hypothetical protein
VVLGLVLLITYTVRVMLLVLLTSAATLALAGHALPQTDGLARLWWRGLAGVLAIQVAQSLVFAAAVWVFFSSDQAGLFGARSVKGTGEPAAVDVAVAECRGTVGGRLGPWPNSPTPSYG